jgi:Domain of unknown function (DUF4142)
MKRMGVSVVRPGCDTDGRVLEGQSHRSRPGQRPRVRHCRDERSRRHRQSGCQGFHSSHRIVNMAEIDLGQLAADRGTADELKKFAQMMITDHTASGDKLNALASDLKIEAPGGLVFVAFDLLHLDGRDLTAIPLDERRDLLARVLNGSRLLRSEPLTGTPAQIERTMTRCTPRR